MPWFSKKNDEGLYKSTRGSLTGTGKSLALSANDTWTSTSSNLTTFRDPKTDVDTSVIAYLAFSKKKASGYLAWKTAADEMRYYPIGVEGYITSVKPLTSTPSTRPVINVEVGIGKASTVKCSGFSVDASKTDCSDAQLTINNDMAIAAADSLFREAIPIITSLAAYKIIDPIPTYVVSNTEQNIVARVTLNLTTYSVDRTGTVKDISKTSEDPPVNINVIDVGKDLTTIPIMYPFKSRESLTALKTKLVARQTAIVNKTTAEQNLQTFRNEEDKAIKENTVKVDRAKRGVKVAETLNALCGPENNGAFPESVLDVNTCATMSKAVTALKQGNSPPVLLRTEIVSTVPLSPTSVPSTASLSSAAPPVPDLLTLSTQPVDDSGAGVSAMPVVDSVKITSPPIKIKIRNLDGSYVYYDLRDDDIIPTNETSDAILIDFSGITADETSKNTIISKPIGKKILEKLESSDQQILQLLRSNRAFELKDGEITYFVGGRRSRKRMNKNKRASSRHRYSRRHMHGHNSRKRYSAGSKSKSGLKSKSGTKSKSASKRRRNQ